MTHEPVLLDEVLDLLKVELTAKEAPRILDGTLGLGGYAEAMLRAFPSGSVLGMDRDPEALRLAQERLALFGPRFRAKWGNFGALTDHLDLRAPFDALVFDLGVSNMQLSEAGRGFSFQHDGPLDMRMNPLEDIPTAGEVLAAKDARSLARIFWEFGGERFSRQIASGVESMKRKGGRLQTTGDLVALIRNVLPAPVQRKMGGHPARKVFQALRIFVNDELGEIESALSGMPGLAAKGCVAVMVSYHSLEDRLVKHRFRSWEKEMGLGSCLTRRPVLPGEDEVQRNYKARSARLRAFQFNDT